MFSDAVKSFWDFVLRKKAAATDRKHSLAEVSRNELRYACSQLLEVFSKELEAARELLTAHSTCEQSRATYRAAEKDAGLGEAQTKRADELATYYEADLVERLDRIRSLLAFVAERRTTAARVMLLEPEHEYLRLLGFLYEEELKIPARRAPEDDFLKQIIQQQVHLRWLTVAIAGRFSAERWHDPVRAAAPLKALREELTRRSIPAQATPAALPPSQED